MPIEVELPDGSIAEFPDGMSDADITAALSKTQFGPQQQATAVASPVDGTGAGQRFLEGVGRSAARSSRGVAQLLSGDAAPYIAGIPGLITQQLGQRGVGAFADQQEAEARQLDAPLMGTTSGFLGDVAGQVVQMGVPAGRVSSFGRAAPFVESGLRGAIFGGAQPIVDGESRSAEAAKSGALGVAGQGIASSFGKLAQGAKDSLSPVVRQSIEMARSAGIPLHLSQVTNSRFLKGLGSVAQALPLTGGTRAMQKQQEAFNRAVSRSFGADAKTLSDDVVEGAKRSIGAVYDDVFSRNQVRLDNSDLRKMVTIENAAKKDLTNDEAAVVSNQLQKIIDDFSTGPISGKKYQSLRASLQNVVDQTPKGKAIKELRTALDKAAFASVGASDSQALKTANSMWANLRTTQKALSQSSGSGTQGGGAAGNVRPTSLYPLIKEGSTREMRELAKIGQNVLKDTIPNSGTPERQMLLNLLGLGGGTYVAQEESLPMWARLAGGGLLAGRAINSPLAARMLGEGKPLRGLARLASPAPRLLPAASPAVTLPEFDLVGGTVGAAPTKEEMDRLRRGR